MRRIPPVLATATLVLMLLTAATPGQAGTAQDPDITDAAGDQVIATVLPDPESLFDRGDVVASWIEESGDNILIHVQVSGEIGGGSAGGEVATTVYEFKFSIDVDGTAFAAGATATFEGTAPTGVASASASDGSVLSVTIPKTGLEITGGETITYAIESEGKVVTLELILAVATDLAPDEGVSRAFVVSGGAPAGDPNDTDADGLNDTWEQDNFGNLDQNASDDPDNDGLSNAGEQQAGTDPNNADSDGDGHNDGDEVANGTDPLDPDDPEPEPSNPTDADADADGLNDTWEIDNFGNITAQNSTGDPDDDGCDNLCEQGAGTDPNNPDTDGDGLSDGHEIMEGTDPLDATDPGDDGEDPSDGACGDVGSHMMSDGTVMCNDGSMPDDADGEATDKPFFDRVSDELKADPGYAAISGAGMLAVITVSLIGLFVRWGL